MSEIWDCYDKNFNLVEGKVLVRGKETSFSEDEYHLVCDIAVKHTVCVILSVYSIFC